MDNKNETISLDRWEIRIIRDSQGGIQRFCLNDLCSFLGQEFVRPNQNAPELCPQSVKLPFKLHGHKMWSVTPADVKTIIQTVRAKDPNKESKCKELENWITSLVPPKQDRSLTTSETISDAPVIFTYRNHIPVPFRIMDNRIMVNATLMAKNYGHQPIEWFRLKDTIRLRQHLAAEGLTAPFEQQVKTTRGRNNGATWIEAPVAVEFAFWLDYELSVWCRERILELAPEYQLPPETQQVPPADKTPAPDKPILKKAVKFSVPKTFSEALRLAAELQSQIEQDEHKIAFYDDLIENRDWFTTTRIAEELRISAQHLNTFLKEWDVCHYVDKQWIACPAYKHLQIDVPRFVRNKQGKYNRCGTALRWNREGREYILKLWGNHKQESHE